MTNRTRIVVLEAGDSGTTTVLDSAQVALTAKADVTASLWPHADLAVTHSFQGDHYEPASTANDPDQGEFLLVVRAKGKSPVVQKLTFVKKGEIVRAKGGWGKGGEDLATAATVSIVNYGQAKKPEEAELPKQSLLTITLYPIQFIVSITTPNTAHPPRTSPNFIDANYRSFAKGRRDYLFDRGQLNPGAIARLMNARTLETEILVKAQNRAIDATVIAGVIPHPDTTKPMSITDFYGVLDEIGKTDAGSVLESIVWSHAYHQGPILSNTTDKLGRSLDRDPNDTDGRPKDWHPQGTVAKFFPKLKDAYAKDGRFRIAGCSHMSNVGKEAEAANARIAAKTGRSQFYEVPQVGGWLQTTLDYSKRSIGLYVQSKLFGNFIENGESAGLSTYLGRAAQALPVTVFGAPPGCEGNMGHITASTGQSLPTMKIVQEPFRGKDPETGEIKIMGGVENKKLVQYYKSEFSTFFEQDELNYMNYDKMLNAPLPDPAWDTRRSLCVHAGENGLMLRLATGLRVVRDRRKGTFERPVVHTEGPKKGHLFVAKKCAPKDFVEIFYPDKLTLPVLHLDHVVAGSQPETAVRDDLALFMTEQGEVFLRTRAAGAKDFVAFSGTVPGLGSGDLIHKIPAVWQW